MCRDASKPATAALAATVFPEPHSPEITPIVCSEMHQAWQRGDVKTVRELNERLIPLHDALFAETSPAPVKYAASLLGRCTAEVRQPLWAIQPETQERVQQAMRGAGLLN